jgi:hypothetical protein
MAVVELHRRGHAQLAIAERIGIVPETIARWLHAQEFRECGFAAIDGPDQALVVQKAGALIVIITDTIPLILLGVWQH